MLGRGQSSLKLLARIIGARPADGGNGAGVTSGSTRRAGSLRDTAHYPKFGFTLAEVLITLGIIGIVAAMTLPTIIQKQQEKVTVTKLKKIYSIISQAYMNAIKDNGSPENWGFQLNSESQSGKDPFLINITPYLKVIKHCYYDEDCDAREWMVYALNGTWNGSKANTRMILADGTLISGAWIYSSACTTNYGSAALKNVCGEFFVDLTGSKEPNTIGKDIFVFYFTKTGIIPFGTSVETYRPFEENCKVNSSGAGYGYGCTAWVIYNENMDYLHCNNLSWNGKTKC